MIAMRILNVCAIASLSALLAACAHPRPPAAHGGLSGQPAPTGEMRTIEETLERAASEGGLAPADAMAARERLDLAGREYRTGLEADAQAGLLAVSLRLGGLDVATPAGRKTCLKSPCN